MRTLLRFAIVSVLVLGGLVIPATRTFAANLDTIADRVFGQPDFTSNTANNGGLSANSVNAPDGLAVDNKGNLYVADGNNNRVLEFDAPLKTGAMADRVFGQPNFTSSSINNGGLSANSLWSPYGVAVDARGNLYVADSTNNRVLEYDTPLTTDTTADRVFGQPDFTSNGANTGGLNRNNLYDPIGVALDSQGDLYVSDNANNRVLEYDTPLTTDAIADRVFGQPDFTSNGANTGGVSANTLYAPYGIGVDDRGDLYVTDDGNNRVLEYDTPLTNDTTADRVFGQTDFSSDTANNGGISAKTLFAPLGVALDSQGDLYVTEYGNSRVLEYNTPLTEDATADRVFGQPDFTSNTGNNGGISANTLFAPYGIAVDAQGNLYVADSTNNRVLEFDLPVPYGTPTLNALSPSTVAGGSPTFTLTVNGSGFFLGSTVRWNGSARPTTYLSSTQLNASISAADMAAGGPFAVSVFTPSPGGGTSSLINLPLYQRRGGDRIADVVLGQPNFQDNALNNPLLPWAANRFFSPTGVAVDPRSGRLFVDDTGHHRVLSWQNAPVFANGQAANLVIGQPDFFSFKGNHAGLSASSLQAPYGLALDAQGDLYVADSGNNRVLEYTPPFTNGMPANRVFGQGGNFTTGLPNNGGASANSLFIPTGVAVDALGNLYVVDSDNNRVLEYNTPITTDTTADRVFGQPDFTSNTANNGGVSASSLSQPFSLALDHHGGLYVADQKNNRVLEYDLPLTTDSAADHVFGQPDFTSASANNGGVSANSLSTPSSLVVDLWGDLYVSDFGNNRLLEYDAPLTTGGAADRVFGQPEFTSATANNGGVSASSLNAPMGVGLDSHNNLYVVDASNQRVLEYDWAMSKIRLPLILR